MMMNTITIKCPNCGAAADFMSPYAFSSECPAVPLEKGRRFKYGTGYVEVLYPEVFPWSDPDNPYACSPHLKANLRQLRKAWGIARCSSCAALKKHHLEWPFDAFYSISTRYGALWAYTKEHLEFIRHLIEMPALERNRMKRQSYEFKCQHYQLPKEFHQPQARAELLTKISERLKEAQQSGGAHSLLAVRSTQPTP